MPLSRLTGVYCPDELKILQRVFDHVCAERSIAPAAAPEAAEHLAFRIVALSNNGVANETGLLRALREHEEHGRRAVG